MLQGENLKEKTAAFVLIALLQRSLFDLSLGTGLWRKTKPDRGRQRFCQASSTPFERTVKNIVLTIPSRFHFDSGTWFWLKASFFHTLSWYSWITFLLQQLWAAGITGVDWRKGLSSCNTVIGIPYTYTPFVYDQPTAFCNIALDFPGPLPSKLHTPN